MDGTKATTDIPCIVPTDQPYAQHSIFMKAVPVHSGGIIPKEHRGEDCGDNARALLDRTEDTIYFLAETSVTGI